MAHNASAFMNARFKIGDCVQLISGSPHMTVVAITKGSQVKCCWFDKEQKEHRSTFPSNALAPERLDDLPDADLRRRLGDWKDEKPKTK